MHLPCTAHSKGAAQICSVVARNLLNKRVHNEIHNTEKPSEALLASFPGCSHVYLQYLITCSMQNEYAELPPSYLHTASIRWKWPKNKAEALLSLVFQIVANSNQRAKGFVL